MSDHNPYSPPTVNVDGSNQLELRPSSRPPRVTLALRLLWPSLFVSMAVSIPLSDASVRNTIRGAAIAAALVSVLFIKIAQGRNWARITNAVYTVSQLLAAVARSVVEDDPAWFTVAFGLAHGVGFVAVVMLFTTPANPWFRSGHESTAIETTSTSDTLTSASDPEPDSRSS